MSDNRISVWEVYFDHQWEGESHGLWSTKEKALKYLSRLGVEKITFENGEHTFMEKNYKIIERLVA